MSNLTHLSSLLSARRVEILERWTQRISREHVDRELSGGELWDDLPNFFDELLVALRTAEDSSSDAAASNGSPASVAP